jgi:hypothetical protein
MELSMQALMEEIQLAATGMFLHPTAATGLSAIWMAKSSTPLPSTMENCILEKAEGATKHGRATGTLLYWG